MTRRKRVVSLAPKVGDVAPHEYNWREQFGGLDCLDGFSVDAGKARGIATALSTTLELLQEWRSVHSDWGCPNDLEQRTDTLLKDLK